MIVLIAMVSFFLDGILSRYILQDSLFLPLFTIVSLIIIYPYFNNDNFRYFRFISIIGLLYDITYLMSIISIVLYRVITFLITIIFNSKNYSLSDLLKSIYNSLILNIIYCIVIYVVTELYSKKNKILRSK